jgi:hypothetical protein
MPAPDALPDAVVYHVTNIVLHVLTAWMLFLFLYRATRQRWASFAVALIWAVHPLRVESVAWVTERKDMVAGVFGFLAMYCYVIRCEKEPGAGKWWFFATCVSLVLSLWAKAMFVTMPLLLMIVDYWPLGRIRSWGDFRRAAIEKWPMWGIVGLSAVGTAYIGRKSNGALAISQMAKMENGILSYVRYLGMHIDFRSLAPYYPYVGSQPLLVCGALAILAAVTGVAIWQRKRWPWLFAGWLWYLVAFLPMIGFVQSYTQAYADRFSYLPAAGLITIVAFAAFQWRRATGLIVAAVFVAAVILGGMTFRQAQYWHDTITLFERAREVTPSNVVLHTALGEGYVRARRLEEAEGEYREIVRLAPKSAAGHTGLAAVYSATNRADAAAVEAEMGVELEPTWLRARMVYGVVLLGDDRYGEAAVQFEEALKIEPENALAQQSLRTTREKGAGRNP